MTWNAIAPPGRRSRRSALSTESLGRSQHNTSVWTTASKAAVRNGRSRPLALTHHARVFKLLGGDAIFGDGQCFEREVGEQHRASGRRRQVDAGPAAAGAEVEQQLTPLQAEPFGEIVGLSDRGVAVGTPVTADDTLLDLTYDFDAFFPVAVGEAVVCLLFLRGDHRGFLSHGR